MAKNTNHQKCKLLVEHFLSHREKIYWPQEIKLAKELLLNVSDLKFWLSIDTPYKIPSLAFFKTPDGADLLQAYYRKGKINLKPKRGKVILDNKIGKDKATDKKKPKNLMDFLNNGKNKKNK